MTDERQSGTEWVPRLGMLEVPRECAELIRGLFELAAVVADHPELPLPTVDVRVYTGTGGWQAKRAVVDQVAAVLGEKPVDEPNHGHYTVETFIGPIRFYSVAITAQAMADHNALLSYSGSVCPAEDTVSDAGESR